MQEAAQAATEMQQSGPAEAEAAAGDGDEAEAETEDSGLAKEAEGAGEEDEVAAVYRCSAGLDDTAAQRLLREQAIASEKSDMLHERARKRQESLQRGDGNGDEAEVASGAALATRASTRVAKATAVNTKAGAPGQRGPAASAGAALATRASAMAANAAAVNTKAGAAGPLHGRLARWACRARGAPSGPRVPAAPGGPNPGERLHG